MMFQSVTILFFSNNVEILTTNNNHIMPFNYTTTNSFKRVRRVNPIIRADLSLIRVDTSRDLCPSVICDRDIDRLDPPLMPGN